MRTCIRYALITKDGDIRVILKDKTSAVRLQEHFQDKHFYYTVIKISVGFPDEAT